jgi:hypothetical protein
MVQLPIENDRYNIIGLILCSGSDYDISDCDHSDSDVSNNCSIRRDNNQLASH